jgi:hypothetical protein
MPSLPRWLVSWAAHRPREFWSRVGFWLLVLAAVSVEAATLFMPRSPLRTAGQRPFIIREFAAGVPIGETFRARSDGLESVDLRLWAERPTSLVLTCRLLTWAGLAPPGSNWVPLYQFTMTRRLPAGESWQHFPFRPVYPSAGQIYQFQVQYVESQALEGTTPGSPAVGVMGSEDDSFKEGNLIAGPVQIVDRDLLFKARGASVYTEFRVRISPLLPKPLRNRGLQLALLGLYNWALATFSFYMIVQAPERGRG